MNVGLKVGGKFIGVEPGTTQVYADRETQGDWEHIAFTQHEGSPGFWDARFVAANLQLSIQPDGTLQTRPAGTFGDYEQLLHVDQKADEPYAVFAQDAAGLKLTVVGQLPAPIPRFHSVGLDLDAPDGKRIVLNGADQFFSMVLYRAGVDLEPYGREMNDLGFNMVRVWLSGSKAQNLNSDLIPDERLYQDLRPFVKFWNDHGVVPLLCVNVDMQDIFPREADRVRNYLRIADELRDSGLSFLLSKGNQAEKNGFSPHEGPDPRVPWWSNGSLVEDASPTNPSGTFEEFCQRRDWPATMLDAVASAVFLYDRGVKVPLMMTEPKGYNADGSRGRINDPHLAWKFGRVYATYWAAAVFKNDCGGSGRLMDAATRDLAQAWSEGMHV